MLVDTIIGVARAKAAPLSGLTDSTRPGPDGKLDEQNGSNVLLLELS